MKAIREGLRSYFKRGIKRITKVVMKSYDIGIIAIVGSYGTEIAREGIYSILEELYDVRRNVRPVWWDMSIPLTILGYEDKQRNILGWFTTLVRARVAFARNKHFPHKIIIELDTRSSDIADYWAEFVDPDAILFLNAEENETNLINKILVNSKDTTVIFNEDDNFSCEYSKKLKDVKVLGFGKSSKGVKYSYEQGVITLQYKDSSYSTKIDVPFFEVPSLVGAFAVSVMFVDDYERAFEKLTNFELHPDTIDKILKSI